MRLVLVLPAINPPADQVAVSYRRPPIHGFIYYRLDILFAEDAIPAPASALSAESPIVKPDSESAAGAALLKRGLGSSRRFRESPVLCLLALGALSVWVSY
jgi:hypothetical protein